MGLSIAFIVAALLVEVLLVRTRFYWVIPAAGAIGLVFSAMIAPWFGLALDWLSTTAMFLIVGSVVGLFVSNRYRR